ncbi:UNVERIFIED_CONTAM: YARHG domain-containing protein [Acetivibrio alkalicellulosi]
MSRLKRVLLIISVLLFVFANQIGYANDAPLVMKGDVAYPINNNSIKLESETIKIRYDAIEDDYNKKHEVEVVFNFHNTGDNTVLELGFPNVANYDMQLIDFEAFSYPDLEPFDVELKKGGILLNYDDFLYNSYYKWDMPFEKDERRSVMVKYKFINHSGADYILRTGSLWKGHVDNIHIIVEFPQPVSSLEVSASPENYYYNGEGIEWHFENINPDFDLYIKYNPIPDFYSLSDEHYTPYQSEKTDYKWDKSLFYIGTKFWDFDNSTKFLYDVSSEDVLVREVEARLATCQLVRNEIYARNGYVFEDSKWSEFFSLQPWYQPDDNFNYDKLNEIEKANVNQIRKFEDAVSGDKSVDEIISELKDYTHKYNDNMVIEYTDYFSPRKKLNYEGIMSEISRIERNRSKIIEEGIQASFPKIDPDEFDIFSNTYIFGNSVFVNSQDWNDNLFRYRDALYQMTRFESMKVVSISPNGRYVIMAGNNIPGFVEDDIYLISTIYGTGYTIGKGDFNNYQFRWSLDDSLQYRDKRESSTINYFNSRDKTFSSKTISHIDFGKFYVSTNGDVIFQYDSKIFYMSKNEDSPKKIIDDGNLMGFCPDDENILYYRALYVLEYNTNDNTSKKLITTDEPIRNFEAINNNLYVIYSGIDTIYCYNYKDKLVYTYKDTIEYEDIKFSPEGDKLMMMSMYKTWVVFGNSHEKKPVDFISRRAGWIDNYNVISYSYDMVYREFEIIKTNVITGEQVFISERKGIRVNVDGKGVFFPDAKPFIDQNNRTLIPVRFVTEDLGAEVDWNQESREVYILKDDINITIRINDRNINVNNNIIEMDTEAIIKDDRTYVPIRYVAESLGATVEWDSKTKTVIINK